MLSFRHTKQTSKTVEDTTFNDHIFAKKLHPMGVLHSFSIRNNFYDKIDFSKWPIYFRVRICLWYTLHTTYLWYKLPLQISVSSKNRFSLRKIPSVSFLNFGALLNFNFLKRWRWNVKLKEVRRWTGRLTQSKRQQYIHWLYREVQNDTK